MKHNCFVKFLLCICICCLLVGLAAPANAVEGTTYTYTISYDGSRYVRTMDAYLPAGTYLNEIGLSSPEDMFLYGKDLYIADTGNQRIVVYSLDTGEIETFGEKELKKPTGISVYSDGSVYVADYAAEQVVIFNSDRTVRTLLGRPTVPYYGNSPYKPQKVDLDSYGNLFVISEGTYEGVLQFDSNGNFNGFFGANRTKGLSLVEWFQKNFYTDAQKAKMSFRTPPNIVSLNVSESDMVYTVTQNDAQNAVKKLNMAGVNVFAADSLMGRPNFVDVAVLPSGGFYAISMNGGIVEYDDTGNLLLSFGGEAKHTDRNGLTAVVSALEVDSDGNIYVLDKERGVLQIWFPTAFAALLHKAGNEFNLGNYQQSLQCWEEVLRMNPMAFMSHLGYGRALFQLGRYQEAAEHFKLIRHAQYYSDCYWEIRSDWLRSHMEQILILAALIVLICFVLNMQDKRNGWKESVLEKYQTVCKKRPLFKALTADVVYFIRHPIDGVYYLKTGSRGSTLAATVLYIVALTVYMVCRGLTSFVFGGGYLYYNNPVAILLIVLIPAVLFLIGSYLISAINDGEGSFKAIYISFAYSLSLFIIAWPILTIISHAFTLTELFIYRMMALLIQGYTIIMLFISIKESHVYNLRKTVTNILLTLFFMIVAILAVIILFILWRELLSFASEVFEEVLYRVVS